MSRILVLGATGTIGGQVAAQLLSTGATVRAGVRTLAKAAALAAAGAEVVRFDYDDDTTWAAALSDVDALFVVAPLHPTFSETVAALVQAAQEVGVGHIVKLSAQGVTVDAPFALARQHALADQAVRDSGLSHTILQPTFFMDNVFNHHQHTIDAHGAFYGASGAGAVAVVASSDVAAMAVAALSDPATHRGQTYVITGADALTDAQIAAKVGAHLGKAVTYVDLPPEQLAAGMNDSGVPPFMVEAMVAFEHIKAQGWVAAASPTVEQVLGRAPLSYDAWLAARG